MSSGEYINFGMMALLIVAFKFGYFYYERQFVAGTKGFWFESLWILHIENIIHAGNDQPL